MDHRNLIVPYLSNLIFKHKKITEPTTKFLLKTVKVEDFVRQAKKVADDDHASLLYWFINWKGELMGAEESPMDKAADEDEDMG